MKKIKLLTTLIALFFAANTFAQAFEGTIEFTRKNYFDQTNYVYYVSQGKVKIDELNKDGKIMGTMLVSLKDKTVIAINHDRKMYMDVKAKSSTKDMSMCMTYKKNEKKDILGYSCTKWVVDNPRLKSKAEYWVIEKGNYFFFKDLLDALKRKDKIALYFMQIKENAGYFPIMGKEIGYDGKVKAEFITNKITRKKIDAKEFIIPKGYEKFN